MIVDETIACRLILEGEIVAFSTETVWGLGANAYDWEACQRIYHIKNRPSDNPLILHVGALEQIREMAQIEEGALEKLRRWMPGPLTVILKKKNPKLFSCGLETLAIRLPQSTTARAFLQKVGVPIAAPSANLSGQPSITSMEEVVAQLGSKVGAVLVGPPSQLGLESTVLDLSGSVPTYLRPGMVSFEALQMHFPNLTRWKNKEIPPSPGLKYKHYAPQCTVYLSDDTKEGGWLGFTTNSKADYQVIVKNNKEYAKELYAFFIQCDKRKLKAATCQPPLSGELEEALLDRIEKAKAL